MLSNEEILLIEKKIEGDLSEDQQVTFNEKFESNAEFKQEALDRTKLLAGIEAVQKVALKKELHDIFQKDTSNLIQEKKSGFKWTWIAIAAGLIPLLYFTFLLTLSSPTNDELFAANFEPIENIITERQGADDEYAQKGMFFYDEQQFDSAKFYLSKVDKSNYSLSLYLGISQLATGKVDESITTFSAVIDNSNNDLLKDYATWFSALAYLKKNDVNKAKESLKVIADNPSSDFLEQANALLQEL